LYVFCNIIGNWKNEVLINIGYRPRKDFCYNELMKKVVEKIKARLKKVVGKTKEEGWAEKQIKEMAKLKGKLILM
jgi:hypothetical protein